jgi:SET domain-containing protein
MLTQYIDASKKGNISRFMNHSCDPNCTLQKWVVGQTMRVGIFCNKDVSKGTELTFDYKFERYGYTILT